MTNQRAIRVSPKEFKDFSVTFNVDEKSQSGLLGNISETGLCAIMPEPFELNENDLIEASIIHWPTGDNIEVEGRIAWKKNYILSNKNHIMLGVEFNKSISFPEYLIALTYSQED